MANTLVVPSKFMDTAREVARVENSFEKSRGALEEALVRHFAPTRGLRGDKLVTVAKQLKAALKAAVGDKARLRALAARISQLRRDGKITLPLSNRGRGGGRRPGPVKEVTAETIREALADWYGQELAAAIVYWADAHPDEMIASWKLATSR